VLLADRACRGGQRSFAPPGPFGREGRKPSGHRRRTWRTKRARALPHGESSGCLDRPPLGSVCSSVVDTCRGGCLRMIRHALMLLCLGLLLPCGCGRNSDPPPRYIGSDGPALAPVPVSVQALDSSIKASAQPLPDLGGKEAPGAADTPAADNENPTEAPTDRAATAQDNPEPTAAQPKPEPDATAPQPADNVTASPPRQRDQVDEVYSGPGMLRAR